MSATASPSPRFLTAESVFPHKEELLNALQAGAVIRREDRIIKADSHYGVYRIRLNIARNPQITKGLEPVAAGVAADMEFFVENLAKNLEALTRAWHVRSETGERFVLIEDDVTGGCLDACISLCRHTEQLGNERPPNQSLQPTAFGCG